MGGLIRLLLVKNRFVGLRRKEPRLTQPCMIKFNERLSKKLSKSFMFHREGRPNLRTGFNQSLLVDWPPALFGHTVEYPRLRACIHKEGSRIFRVGKPVNSLLSLFTL